MRAILANGRFRAMPAMSHAAGALERWFAFDSPGNVARATVAIMLLGGVVSLLLGQDANWDLRNYHLYNGYALLHDRMLQDLAPAQMQSYFSPVLDVFHYLLMVRLPAPLAGFVLGALHGLVFLPLAGVASLAMQGQVLRAKLAPLLALAGLCTSAFLSEFGGSMADNTTALFVLAAVYFTLSAQRRQAEGATRAEFVAWGLAGALLGIAVALKLTNAIYAVALAMAALCAGGAWWRRLTGVGVLALVALVVAALLAGWWYLRVWQVFGNPLFPQFNALFQGPLAAPISVADTRWLPRGAWQNLTWPLQFAIDPLRVSEIRLVQLIWPLLYVTALATLLRGVVRRNRAAPAFAPTMRALLVFFGVGYLLWQGLFGIHRYLVALELLAPLVLWYLFQRLLPSHRAMKLGGWAIGLVALASLLGWNTWGHERWASRGFSVEAPPMPEPGRSVVLLAGGEPQAWRVPLLPAQARYVGAATNFPESSAYREHMAAIVEGREERFVMIPAYSSRLMLRWERMNVWARRFRLSEGRGCERLVWLATRVRGLRSEVERVGEGRCRLIPRSGMSSVPDIASRQARELAGQQLAGYGWALDESTCVTLASRIGQGEYPYQWCRLRLLP